MEQLIDILKSNARTSVEDIAKMLASTPEAVAKEIDALEKQGIIRGYQAILNEDQMDQTGVTSVIEVSVAPEREGGFNAIAQRISKFSEVSSLYLMSGNYDLMLFVVGDNLHEVALFVSEKLSTIPGITGTATHFMLKTYKHHGVMMEQEDEYNRLKVSP